MKSQILDRLYDGYITTIEIYCRKMAIIEDKLLSDMLERYYHHGKLLGTDQPLNQLC